MNSTARDSDADWTDQDYVESSRNGCPEHFRLLVQHYQKPMFAYLASRMVNPLKAEEAAQESFVRAFLTLKSLRKPESFYAWLLGIAGRLAGDVEPGNRCGRQTQIRRHRRGQDGFANR